MGQGTRGLRPRPHSQWGGLSPVPRRDGMTLFPEAPPHSCRHCPIHTRGPRPFLEPLPWGRWPCHPGLCPPRPVRGASLWKLTHEFGPVLQWGLGWFCSLRTGSLVPWGWHVSLSVDSHRTQEEGAQDFKQKAMAEYVRGCGVAPPAALCPPSGLLHVAAPAGRHLQLKA